MVQLIELSQEMNVCPRHVETIAWEHASHAETAGSPVRAVATLR